MKKRNVFACGCIAFLFLFVQCETNSSKKDLEKKPVVKNVIFMIGDGMGVSQVYAGLTANKNKLNLERSQAIGFSKTYSANDYITDSAAGGTALACGQKTTNGTIGMDTLGNPIKSMLHCAAENGLSTGIVVSCNLTHATPASFIAHQPNRNMSKEIAADYMNVPFTVAIGGGRKYFEKREDDRNLTDELKAKEYQVAYTLDEMKNVSSGKLIAL
ncbi:MAG: alkaline phosphatase, partial [Dysgonamonadaceae bacterium]|nr:alkaline phosphatase [Dysgonamonadaceae bacterium]